MTDDNFKQKEYKNPPEDPLYKAPLLSEEKKIEVSGVLIPSGESNFFDFAQHQNSVEASGRGINAKYPHYQPEKSGEQIINTYPPDILGDIEKILDADRLNVPFSISIEESPNSTKSQLTFNDYIHYVNRED
jgi:hypothetical protein